MINKNDQWEELPWEEYPLTVNWDETKEITGKIVEYKTVTFPDRDADCLILDCGTDEKRTIWRSVGLSQLFTLPVGSYVKVKCLGMKKSPTTKRLFRSFEIFVRSDTIIEPF